MRSINQYLIEKKRCLDKDLPYLYVNAETGVINARWTHEMAQDLSAFHNIDAEAELTAILSEEITNQINRNMINNLFNNELF